MLYLLEVPTMFTSGQEYPVYVFLFWNEFSNNTSVLMLHSYGSGVNETELYKRIDYKMQNISKHSKIWSSGAASGSPNNRRTANDDWTFVPGLRCLPSFEMKINNSSKTVQKPKNEHLLQSYTMRFIRGKRKELPFILIKNLDKTLWTATR